MAFKPITPATVVVLAGTILFILVSLSTPFINSIYFLSVNVPLLNNGEILYLGVWGYCTGTTCTAPTLGYQLDSNRLFGGSALANSAAPLINGLTYVLILHPIAAGLGALATLFGIISHFSSFQMIGTTTSFASLAGTIGLIAFIFDIVLFQIARNRILAINSSAQANLGNAIWLTLVGALCFMFSGCFFTIGRCVVRKQRRSREASEQTKPRVDQNYSNGMRNDAMVYGGSGMYKNNNNNENKEEERGLPAFGDRNGEVIPLHQLNRLDREDEVEQYGNEPYNARIATPLDDRASLISGVGEGYGPRRTTTPFSSMTPDRPGLPSQPSQHSHLSGNNVVNYGYTDQNYEPVQYAPPPSQYAPAPSQYIQAPTNQYYTPPPQEPQADYYNQQPTSAISHSNYSHSPTYVTQPPSMHPSQGVLHQQQQQGYENDPYRNSDSHYAR